MIVTEAIYNQETLIQYYQEVQSPLYVGIDGLRYTLSTEKYLDTVKPSGVIIMGGNIQSQEQLSDLISDIHSYAKSKGITIKVAIDEEGGLVSRLKALPSYPKDFKGVNEKNPAKTQQQIKLLQQIGIDINFAPVADVAYTSESVMKERSGGDTPEKVAEKALAYSKSLIEKGIAPTLKHFPGLGRTNKDTHLDKVEVEISLEDWIKTDAIPYTKAQETLSQFNVMLGHVTYPQIDKYPASISSKWVSILRNNIGFKGIIFTDDLKMQGLSGDASKYKCNTLNLSDEEYAIPVTIKQAKEAGVNHPLIILTQSQTQEVFSDWIRIEKDCR
ncbi:MAG TPA: glycoside hydrolase family 3 N-terminal domain-containing protein [Candidatus Dojkabacteria bacterium]|nr:glycoside hydrolase family 3 N-terminal domain-containing protein [Candidatus Dojkabacteria bacterium]